MRVIQLSDLHLGPEDHDEPVRREHNAVAWANARRTARWLGEQPDPRGLTVVITGDLTDAGHVNPDEFAPAVDWLEKLRAGVARVLVVPGNHDTGNFVTARHASPTVSAAFNTQWEERVGPARFAYAADGHRLVGLNSQLWSSGLAAEAAQLDWLAGQVDAADLAGEDVHVFQHAPLFLHTPREVRGELGTYWCPDAPARDRVLELLDRPHVRTFSSGHVHRRRDLPNAPGAPPHVVWCPALSGTHSDAAYFPPNDRVGTHALPSWTLDADGTRFDWIETGLPVRMRLVR